MMIFPSVKKVCLPAFVTILAIFALTFQSCRKKRTEMANMLYKKTHNPVFRDVTPEGFADAFKKAIAIKALKTPCIAFIRSYYHQHDYQPQFIEDHLFNNDLQTAADYYMKADEHGLNEKMFEAEKLDSLINKFHGKNGIKTLEEAYKYMAETELTAATSLVNYSNALQYGVVNPKKIFKRYYLDTKAPDSLSMVKVFQIKNMKTYLDSLQPNDPQYITLQKALKTGFQAPGLSQEETRRILIVNLERLRWRNKPYQNKYVIVNIPDYTLNVMDKDSGKSVLKMKVCVGGGRNMENQNTVLSYNDTAKVDNPFPHETPLLNSAIHSVEVNPVWNIPNSIATKEIIVEAAKDRYYLANKNIQVYKNDRLIKDPEYINWSKVTKANCDYEFKQKPGADNSLGKIKFLFKNVSSVYLHDTPAKSAFFRTMRAVSHGCVRLGDPQALALSLFGVGDKYKKIVEDMGKNNPDPTTIYLPKRVPVYITYITCWNDENNTLQFRNDVYGLDIVLYDSLQKELKPALN